jgi:hypothetical protein
MHMPLSPCRKGRFPLPYIAMSLKRQMLMSFLMTLLIWLVFAWPLPRYARDGIPSSAHNIERGGVRRMIVGDHLQLHYFYWLFSDMLAGHTPLFENRYEFNTGNDSERYKPGVYNMPLSFVYAAAVPFTGRAMAWNIVLFVSLWLTVLWAWLALRGIPGPPWLTLLAAAFSIAFPFRWIMLFGGSPTGLAMMWLALLAFGFNLVIREEKPIGGYLASLALLAAYFNDRHVFFFSFMAMPVLVLFFLLLREAFPWRSRSFWLALVKGTIPLIATTLILGALAAKTALYGFTDTSLAAGRTIEEVKKFAPLAKGLIETGKKGLDAHAYLGILFFLMAILHIWSAVVLWKRRNSLDRRRTVAGLVLWVASGLTILLALGPNGPWDGALFDFIRAHVPGSKALRQPAKIYSLFTLFLPAVMLIALTDIRAAVPPRIGKWLRFALPILLLIDYAYQIQPTICLIDRAQPAYEAVAKDAAQSSEPARVVILPLWPGDSDWAAVYQHYVSLYRIRMLNGYKPVVPTRYQTLVKQFASLNIGLMNDTQADALLTRGFRYVILHEDAYPEKISPFPVVFTRDRLLAHPRLELLRHAETVWAFKILEAPRTNAVSTSFPILPPARFWEFERQPGMHITDETNALACNGGYTVIQGSGSVTGRSFRVTGLDDPAFYLRLRGHGILQMAPSPLEPPVTAAVVETPDWTWYRLPLDPSREKELAPVFTAASGTIDADYAMMLSKPWSVPEPGVPVTFRADTFFHAGWSDPETGYVHLRPDYEPDKPILFYGPRLPFGKGKIRVEVDLESRAPAGTPLGRIILDNTGDAWGPFAVTAGEPFVKIIDSEADRPVCVNFQYRRRTPVILKSVTITRLDSL